MGSHLAADTITDQVNLSLTWHLLLAWQRIRIDVSGIIGLMEENKDLRRGFLLFVSVIDVLSAGSMCCVSVFLCWLNESCMFLLFLVW